MMPLIGPNLLPRLVLNTLKAMTSLRSLRVRQSKLGRALIMPRLVDRRFVATLQPNARLAEY